MAARRSSFRQWDLQRALRAVKRSGLEVLRVEVEATGKLVIVTTGDTPTAETSTPLDRWLATNARAS